MEFDFDRTRFVANSSTHTVGVVEVSSDKTFASFYETVDGRSILRCICSIEEMVDRLKMWNFE